MDTPCDIFPGLRTMLFAIWLPPCYSGGWSLHHLVPGLGTMLFAIGLSFCYIDWWTHHVTFSLVLEPCSLLSDCRPVTLVVEVSITWFLVLEPYCLQSDCRSGTLVDEQNPSLVSWPENRVVFCLTVSLLHWLMNRLCHLVPGIRKIFCVGSRTVWWTNPIT